MEGMGRKFLSSRRDQSTRWNPEPGWLDGPNSSGTKGWVMSQKTDAYPTIEQIQSFLEAHKKGGVKALEELLVQKQARQKEKTENRESFQD
ncbi:MAG: hypothetical protein ACP5FH_01075 [Terracidiphilus sp.]